MQDVVYRRAVTVDSAVLVRSSGDLYHVHWCEADGTDERLHSSESLGEAFDVAEAHHASRRYAHWCARRFYGADKVPALAVEVIR